jgi:hypothetical protein
VTDDDDDERETIPSDPAEVQARLDQIAWKQADHLVAQASVVSDPDGLDEAAATYERLGRPDTAAPLRFQARSIRREHEVGEAAIRAAAAAVSSARASWASFIVAVVALLVAAAALVVAIAR